MAAKLITLNDEEFIVLLLQICWKPVGSLVLAAKESSINYVEHHRS